MLAFGEKFQKHIIALRSELHVQVSHIVGTQKNTTALRLLLK